MQWCCYSTLLGVRGHVLWLCTSLLIHDFYSPCRRCWKVLVHCIAVNIRVLLTMCNGGAWNNFLWLMDTSCVTPCMLCKVLLVKLNTACPEYFFSDRLRCKHYYCTPYLPACPMNKNWSHNFPSDEWGCLGTHAYYLVIWNTLYKTHRI